MNPRYYDLKFSLKLVKILLLFVLLTAFYLNEWGYLLSEKLSFPRPLVQDALFLLIFYSLLAVLVFPLELLDDYLIEKKYRLCLQSFRGWLFDYAKSFLLGAGFLLAAALAFYGLLRHTGSLWYIGAWLTFAGLNVLVALILPQAIIPMFFKYREIEDAVLKQRLLSFACAQGLPLKAIFVIDASSKSRKANAFICGLGKSKRMVLTDTLIQHFSPDEIEAAVAHEIAHIKHRDAARMLTLNTLASFCFFYAAAKAAHLVFRVEMDRLYDIGSVPFFALVFFMLNLLFFPLGNAFIRGLERSADRLGLTLLKNREAFVSLIQKLCAQNLSECEPPAWKELLFFNHPSPARRIRYARAWKE